MFKGTLIAAVAGSTFVIASCNHAAEHPVTKLPTQATAPSRQPGSATAALKATDPINSHADIKSSQKADKKEKQKATAKTTALAKAAAQQAKTQPEKPQQIAKMSPQPQPGQSQATQKGDPVAALIAQVEKQYEQGQAEYQAGHLESAKSSFDKAVDMLLQSPIDIRSDDRLQREFDKIIEGVNQLEMVA